MIGSIIDICRQDKSINFIENTFFANKMDVPLAPGDGLYLYNVINHKQDRLQQIQHKET